VNITFNRKYINLVELEKLILHPSNNEFIIISHGQYCEMGQFHLIAHIFKSETRLAEFLIKENVNQRMELSHLA